MISKLIRKKNSEIDPEAQVILFGSRARGDERTDSDWDVLILTEYSMDFAKENQFRNHLYDIELETGEPISLFAYSKIDWNTKQRISPFYANVSKEGINLWAQMKGRNIVFDFDPESVKPQFDHVIDMIRKIEKEIVKITD